MKFEVARKQRIIIECKIEDVRRDYIKTVRWVKKYKNLENIEKLHVDMNKYEWWKPSFEILFADKKDSCFYVCIVELQDKELWSEEIELCVYGLISDHREYDVNFATRAVLQCHWIDMPLLFTVKWSTPGAVVSEIHNEDNDKYSCMQVDKEPTLYIFNADSCDSGRYECSVEFQIDVLGSFSDSTYRTLKVCKELSVTSAKTFYIVLLNGFVTLKCTVSGNPPPHLVYWIKVEDDSEIMMNKFMDLSNSKTEYSLTINNADDNDQGVYKCIAIYNDLEIKSEDIHLSVLGGNV
ncbi:unnamed protein product [Mytilus coruscus]|uniref:Ig-like domain-containing protein n=1 Tax=Mytilus coruscus TaxID=42192 RepID=A0A6J8BUR5_MYTCO|nr:unnamed protein product [Mytilus coruscus]